MVTTGETREMQEKWTPAKGPDYKEGRVLRSSFLFMKGEEMDDKTIKAILSALEAGHRVQLKQLRDGTIKIQVVFQKELKIT